MSDARLRDLERKWRETGASDDGAAYLVELERTGTTLEDALLDTRGEAARLLKTHPVAYIEPKRRLIERYMQQAEERGLQPHHPDYQADYQVPATLHAAYHALGDNVRQEQHSAQYVDQVLREVRTLATPPTAHRIHDTLRTQAQTETPGASLNWIQTLEPFDLQVDTLGIYLAEASKRVGVAGATALVTDLQWSDTRVSASVPFMHELLREDRMSDAAELLRYQNRRGGIEYPVTRYLAQRGRYAEIPPLLVWRNENAGTVQQLRGFLPCAVYAMMATTLNGQCFDEVSR